MIEFVTRLRQVLEARRAYYHAEYRSKVASAAEPGASRVQSLAYLRGAGDAVDYVEAAVLDLCVSLGLEPEEGAGG